MQIFQVSQDEWRKQFLVGLGEVIRSERQSSCISLIKEDIGFRKKDVLIENDINHFYFILGKFHEKSN